MIGAQYFSNEVQATTKIQKEDVSAELDQTSAKSEKSELKMDFVF